MTSLVVEGNLVTHISLQAALDTLDTACSMATFLCYALDFMVTVSRLLKEVQTPALEGCDLFNARTDEALQPLKDLRATLHSLRLHASP